MQSNPEKAVDAPRARRPGVPEMKAPAPVGIAHWLEPEKQKPHGEILMDPDREELTATFGTGPAPAGLSGAMRRVAYRIPDYEVKRWMLLLLADRVDAVEHDITNLHRRPGFWVVVGAASFGIYRLARRR